MNRFNLTFWGEILAGQDPEKVKARFGKLFDIRDPERLEHFFSGETIILRRNLDRKVAGEYFSKLRKLGVEARLDTVDPAALLAEEQRKSIRKASKKADSEEPDKASQWEQARREAEAEALQRSHKPPKKPKTAEKTTTPSPEEKQAQLRATAEAEALRQQGEEDARRQQAEKEEARQRVEEEARERAAAEKEAERRKAEDEAARKKAEKLAAQQKAAEEATRIKAAEELARKEAAEKAAREKAKQEKARKKAAEDAARKKAEREEARRKAAEETARKKAEREEARRKAAEETARKKAEREEARRKAAEEAARKKAEREEARRKAAEETARKKAAREEARRKAAEEAALKKAELEEARRKAAEEAAREKAELDKKKRLAREEEEKEAALVAETRRAAAEAVARKKALEEEKQRKQEALKKQQAEKEHASREARERKRRKEAEAKQAEERARAEAERQQQRARQEEKRADEKRQREEKQQQAEALKREQQAQRQLMEEQAIARAAEELAAQPALKPVEARVKTSIELPRRYTGSSPTGAKRQAGAPNYYRIHPFRNTPAVRARAAEAAQKTRGGFTLAAVALALLLLLAGRYLSLTGGVLVSGPQGMASGPNNSLLILAGDQLLMHDRSGVEKSTIAANTLGMRDIGAPLAFTPEGDLLIRAQSTNNEPEGAGIHRCDPQLTSCEAMAGELSSLRVDALSVHPFSGEVFVTDQKAGELLKLSPEGEINSRGSLKSSEKPVMRLDSGLLFMNSAEGPAISVYRYEDSAFGRQLDEILVLPPPALEQGQTRVGDFARVDDFWWVRMDNPDTLSTGLYLFDSQWKYLRQIPAKNMGERSQMHAWGSKLLLWSPDSALIQRFVADGAPEAALRSEALQALIDEQHSAHNLKTAAWFAGFTFLLLTALASFSRAYHQYLRGLVYRSRPTRGAEPIDEYTGEIQWADPMPDRAKKLRWITLSCGVLSVAAAFLCIGLGASVSQLTAVLIAASGPLLALTFFRRGEIGHAGIVEDSLVLVDHRDMYHMASGSRIQYRGPFLLIDDVVVFTGTSLLPVLSPTQVSSQLNPVAEAGIRVDRKTVAVKLLENRHPLVAAALAIGVALLLAGLTLLWGQLF